MEAAELRRIVRYLKESEASLIRRMGDESYLTSFYSFGYTHGFCGVVHHHDGLATLQPYMLTLTVKLLMRFTQRCHQAPPKRLLINSSPNQHQFRLLISVIRLGVKLVGVVDSSYTLRKKYFAVLDRNTAL